jgi:hypothetical protein
MWAEDYDTEITDVIRTNHRLLRDRLTLNGWSQLIRLNGSLAPLNALGYLSVEEVDALNRMTDPVTPEEWEIAMLCLGGGAGFIKGNTAMNVPALGQEGIPPQPMDAYNSAGYVDTP